MALNDDGSASATITAENTFTDAVPANGSGRHRGTVTIVGDGGAAIASTISIQMRRTGAPSTEWITVASRTAADVVVLEFTGSMEIRAGIDTGDFSGNDVDLTVAAV